MAATFVDLTTGRGVRIIALEDSRELAQKLYPHIENKSAQQMAAYRELRTTSFSANNGWGWQWTRANFPDLRANVSPAHSAGKGELWPLQRSGRRKVVSKLRTA